MDEQVRHGAANCCCPVLAVGTPAGPWQQAQHPSFCSPALLVRAARHYEGAEQILIRQAVMSSCQFVTVCPVELPPLGHWVQVACPARLDLSGELFHPKVVSELVGWRGMDDDSRDTVSPLWRNELEG